MLKTLRKLFSLDESEFEDINDNIEYEEMKKEVLPKVDDSTIRLEQLKKQFASKTNQDTNEHNMRFTEVDMDVDNLRPNKAKSNTMFDDSDFFDEEDTKMITITPKPAVKQTAIATPANKVIIRESADDLKELKTKARIQPKKVLNSEEYVLRDLISPMRGVIKKETNSLKKPEKVERSKIIKLRDSVKVAEIKPAEPVWKLDSSVRKESISETSRFTLVEDNTGEMRIFLDEDTEE